MWARATLAARGATNANRTSETAMPDIDDVILEAGLEVKRLSTDVKSFRDKIDGDVAGVNDRVDQLEMRVKRGGGGGDFNTKAETADQREHKSAFNNYFRKGAGHDDGSLGNLQFKALSVASDPDGGYFVPTQVSQRIIEKVQEIAPMRRLAMVETISTAELEIPMDTDDAEAVWGDETSTPEETRTPQLGKRRIVVHDLVASPRATQRLLEDAAIDVSSWLVRKLSTAFAKKEGAAFVQGTGRGMPRGFLTYAPGLALPGTETLPVVMTGAASGFPDGSGTADALLQAVYTLKAAYRDNASWMMPRSLQYTIRALKDERGAYLWQPGLQAGQPDRLLGYPVYDCEDMPGMIPGSLSIAFGDFRAGYTIVDRLGITVLRDPYTKKPFVEFNTRKRVGGDVVNFEALVLMKTGLSTNAG